jgi:hypothetical protein
MNMHVGPTRLMRQFTVINVDAVDGGHRAVKYSRIFGVLDEVYGEGTHLRVPWLETAVVYDVRAKPRNIPSLTGTKGRDCHLKRCAGCRGLLKGCVPWC